MFDIDDIYSDLIMEHSMNSYNKRILNNYSCSLDGKNPNCGDEINVQVLIENNTLKDIAFTGYGCAISQSSTSIMIDTLRGLSVENVKEIVNIFIKMIKREQISKEEEKKLQNCIAFKNISNMPARVKCALLPWYTVLEILEKECKN